MSEKKTCKDCPAFEPGRDIQHGTCRCNPPTYPDSGLAFPPVGVFPAMPPDGWCYRGRQIMAAQ